MLFLAGTMASPTPPSGGPSPLTIGRQFVKQYYHVLMTSPDDIVKFYTETAVFSHGEGSQPTTPTTIGPEKAVLLKDRLFSSHSFRVDLENGAIDAQMSCGGGVLVVVTGHMIEEENVRRAFCHTFFLNVVPNSKKKHYFVYNDVFRFLSEEDNNKAEVLVDLPETQEEPVEEPRVEEELAVEPAQVPEPVAEEPIVEEPIVAEEEPPMYEPALEPEPAIEETKEEIVEEVKPRRKSKSRSGRKKSLSPTAAESPKPTPGSWASLVANTNAVPVPMSPAKRTVVEKKEAEAPVKEEPKPEVKRGPKRDPENTVVIKNVPEGTKEAEVRELFEPFAKQTNGKIVGLNVSAGRSLAFVDFDSSAPVHLALQEKHRLQLHGRILDVEQKVIDRNKRASGGRQRGQAESGSSTNGVKRSSKDQQRRRNSGGGRGERGGGGGRGGRGGR